MNKTIDYAINMAYYTLAKDVRKTLKPFALVQRISMIALRVYAENVYQTFDVIQCEDRAIHHGVAIGSTLPAKGKVQDMPINEAARILHQIKNEVKAFIL